MPSATRHRAYDIIRNEHRAIAAVIHCFEEILKEVRDEALAPSFELFALIIRYLAEFSDQYHHPKEDDYLFPAVAQCDREAGEVIRALQQQHEECARKTASLAKLLADWKAGMSGGEAAFHTAAREYIALQWEHMRKEETAILPVAREVLSEEDWAALDAAFEGNEDPIFGANPQAAFNGLFRKIVAIAPAPWGLGGRYEPKRASPPAKARAGPK